MKAWVSHRAGGPEDLVLEERATPRPGEQELLVKVDAVGINFPDALLLRDLYQVKPPRPLTPGSEFCGVVQAVGPGASAFAPGDVVIGRSGWGAMAEYLSIHESRCIAIPPAMPRAEAAAFLFTYATAMHALLDAARLQPHEHVLVLGAAGGVGSAVIQIGRAMGAHLVAAASTREKLDFAISLGAEQGCVYPADLATGEAQRRFTADLKALAPQGYGVVVDPVGGPYSEPALRSLGQGGRHLVIGFAAGIPRVPLNLTLLKSSRIIGVDWRSFAQTQPQANNRHIDRLFELWRAGAVAPPVTERFPFSQTPQAIQRLESRSALGKVVVCF